MTQETPIWLDYSKPPPGYRVDEQDDGEWDWSVGGDVPRDGNAHLITTEAEALAAAWAHYKAEHDPPGMRLVWEPDERSSPNGAGEWHVEATGTTGPVRSLFFRAFIGRARETETTMRAAAWAWHDRRRAIVADVDAQTCSGGRELAAWLARALAWTEAECTEIEAYAALPFPRSVDMPQALQRVLLTEAQRT